MLTVPGALAPRAGAVPGKEARGVIILACSLPSNAKGSRQCSWEVSGDPAGRAKHLNRAPTARSMEVQGDINNGTTSFSYSESFHSSGGLPWLPSLLHWSLSRLLFRSSHSAHSCLAGIIFLHIHVC